MIGPPEMRKAHSLIFAVGLVAAAPAAAQAAAVTVTYNIDIGPLTVSVVKFSVDLSGGEAHAKARIRSAGMSRVFSEFGATAEADTRLQGADAGPVSYKITRDQSDVRKVTTLTWQGGAVSYDPPIKNAERRAKLDAALAGGVIDPVTAVLRMGTEGESPCPSTHEVFDGREVFELALTDKGPGTAGGEAAWQGEVRNCDVRWEPIAGRSKDKGIPGDSYQVAFAPVAELEDGRKLWLPVEMAGRIKGMGFKGYVTKISKGPDSAAE